MSVNIDLVVDTTEWDPMAIRLNNAPVAIARRFIREYPAILVRAMRSRTPVRRGHLQSSERAEAIDDFRAQITWNHVGKFVDQGTRPHIIRAKRARALAFPLGRRTAFAKSVNHPGTEPHFIRERSIADTTPLLIELLRAATGKELGAG